MVTVTRNWRTMALRGVVSVLFGLTALAWPGTWILALVVLFGTYALIDGVLAVVATVRAAGEHERWGPLLLEGVTGIVAGVVTLVWPQIGALTLLYVIAAWALITGVIEIAAAIRLRREIEGEWLLGFSGIVSIIFGVVLAVFPGAGAITVVWTFGAYALVFGTMLIALSLRLRVWPARPVVAHEPTVTAHV